MIWFLDISSVQSLSHVQLFVTPWTATHQTSLSNSWSWLKLMSIELVMPSNHLILCCPLLLPPSIFPIIRVFSNESVLSIRWPGYWSFSFSISPSNEYSGLISFRMDWLDLLEVQRTLKSLLQHYSSEASILWRSAFFIVQVLYLPLLIPFFPLCPTPLHGRFIALSEVCGLLPCSVDILCESLLLVVYFLFSCEKVSSPCCFSAVFILSSVLAF